MDAQPEPEVREKGAAGLPGSAAPAVAQRAPTSRGHGFSTAQILVMTASGCVTALAVLILVLLAGDPSLGAPAPPLVAFPAVPRITSAFEAPLRAIPPPAPPAEPAPEPTPTAEPTATAPSPSTAAASPPSSAAPLLGPRPPSTSARPPPPPPAPPPTTAPPPNQQSNPGPLFQREN